MGESTYARATLRFDRRLRLEFLGATITSDAGLLACRELDDALGVCPRIRSWRRKPPRNNLLTVIWTLSWSN